ncbi:antirepressor [Bacillus sp. J14TS2]|uniref:phage antirepressor n=1 Tax=Bacillus sp. J14TS2 TaxID=2807188 RepID=UPI001B1178F1|nr:phage antirepressor [Bacillus sp. J14TS2]GIN71181.1 antirepressor [Bacillus sp. J14TS2]
MNQLTKMFDGQNLVIINDQEGPKFLLKDVCNILEIGNPSQVKTRLEDGVITNEVIQDRLGRNQKATFINEDGLYDVILDSRKPEAKRFRKWITSEVLPSIRKHGAYATPQTIENIISDPDFGIQLLTNLKDERDKRIEAERTIEQQKPKVVFAESCLVSQDTVLVKEVAKLACNQGIMIGQNKLYNKLRDWGYIQKNNTQPTQRAIESGYFQVLQRNIQTPDGSRLARTTKVTTKGQLKILNRLKKELQEKAAI